MKKLFILALFIFFLGSIELKAQKLSPNDQVRVNEAFKGTSTAYFSFTVTSMQEVAPLAKIISVEKVQGKLVYAHATKDQFSQFVVKGYPYTLIHKGGSAAKKTPPAKGKSNKAKPKAKPTAKAGKK